MENTEYFKRLHILLTALYSKSLDNKERIPSPKIEGFIEAGLCSGVATRSQIEDVIDQAHKEIYGFGFNEKIRPSDKNSEILDIPTYIRDRKEI